MDIFMVSIGMGRGAHCPKMPTMVNLVPHGCECSGNHTSLLAILALHFSCHPE